MFLTDLQAILQKCLRDTCGKTVRIERLDSVTPAPANQSTATEEEVFVRPLGGGFVLSLHFTGGPHIADLQPALERAVRDLREAKRRHGEEEFPTVEEPASKRSERERILARIKSYLEAFQNSQSMLAAVITSAHEPLCIAGHFTDEHEKRLPLLLRQVDSAGKSASGTSHATITTDDTFAMSFYFDAHLVAVFSGPYSSDFVAHRAKLVAREVAPLLALLTTPPDDPAHAAPIP